MNHGSLFSGIGGFDLAAQKVGWTNRFHCEWNPFGQKVLKYYWPEAESYTDITKTDFTIWRGKIDVLTGGFPCQPYSQAGKRLGKEDDRHLWPEMLRAIREIQPRYVVGENVSGLINWNDGLVFDEVQADLEAEGYKVTPFVLPAAGVGAPHRRDRIWFVAHSGLQRQEIGQFKSMGTEQLCKKLPTPNSKSQRLREAGYDLGRPEKWDSGNGCEWIAADTKNIRLQSTGYSWERRTGFKDCCCDENGTDTNALCNRLQRGSNTGFLQREREVRKQRSQNLAGISGEYWQDFPTQSPVCSRNDGIPAELDGISLSKWRNETIKAAGNAIVHQVAVQIFQAINEFEKSEQ